MKVKNEISDGVLYFLLGIAVITLITTIFMATKALSGNRIEPLRQTGNVYNILNKISRPVNLEKENTIIRPYNDENIKIVKDYYDFKKSEEEQMKSLIYYQDTYMQSSGVAYSNGDKFNVLSVLDGTVLDIVEDELVGNSITIDYGTFKAIYQSLSEIDVKKGDKVTRGQVIGISGTSNINSTLGNHLYFEIIVNDTNVNPEEYYDKTL